MSFQFKLLHCYVDKGTHWPRTHKCSGGKAHYHVTYFGARSKHTDQVTYIGSHCSELLKERLLSDKQRVRWNLDLPKTERTEDFKLSQAPRSPYCKDSCREQLERKPTPNYFPDWFVPICLRPTSPTLFSNSLHLLSTSSKSQQCLLFVDHKFIIKVHWSINFCRLLNRVNAWAVH